MTKAAGSWPLLALAGLACAAVPACLRLWGRHRHRAESEGLARLRITLPELDAMGDQEFEYALRDLLVRDGWAAQKVGQGGDQAADVIGARLSLGRIVVQAKHTRVGGKEVPDLSFPCQAPHPG